MFCVVVVAGILKENLSRRFRNMYLSFHDALKDEDFLSYIPVIYWTRETNSRINKIKEGSLVTIKGHLESDEEYGVYIVCESIHFTK